MKRTKVFLIVALMCVAVQGAWAQFDVTKDATMSEDWTVSPANPVNSGETVTATYSGSKHVKSVKFVKKMRTPEVNVAANSLTYTAASQALVTASTTGGTLQYKLGAEGTYSTTIPTATNAGTYTVYYKVVGDEAYSDVAEASVSVTIAKAVAAAKSNKANWIVGDIICSNGNAYTIDANTTIPTGVTPSAIVAYKGSATGDADYKNGLAFALTDGYNGESKTYIIGWTAYVYHSKPSGFDNPTRVKYEDNIATSVESGRYLNSLSSGWGSSTRDGQGASPRVDWPAFYYASFGYTVARPSETITSKWFLPSIYQWNQMVKGLLNVSTNLTTSENANMAFEKINEKLQTAIDDENVKAVGLADKAYWTSSEMTADEARCYRAKGVAGYGQKSETCRVRPIIAF